MQLPTIVTEVHESSTSYGVFREGDVIYKVNGNVVYVFGTSGLRSHLADLDEAVFIVIRDGEFKEIKVERHEYFVYSYKANEDGYLVNEDGEFLNVRGGERPIILLDEDGEPIVQKVSGFGISIHGNLPQRVGFWRSIPNSFGFTFHATGQMFSAIGGIFSGGGEDGGGIGGPVTMITGLVNVISNGIYFIVLIVAILSINLAIFNILPIPALDGSRILFAIVEWIRKKPLNRKIEGIIHAVGFFAIIAMALAFDVFNFFGR
jgi:hypothetical protein